MKDYLKAISTTNQLIIDECIGENELHRMTAADIRWGENRKKSFQTRNVKKGEIYQFEFGKNYIPEMAYEHRGLVIGVNKRLLYVLPIFSYKDSTEHRNAYHPQKNPFSTSDLFLLLKSEFPFISHDSVLKLNDIRTISINRILYRHKGWINPVSENFQIIQKLVIKKYFFDFSFEHDKLQEDYKNLSEENNRLKKEIENLKNSIAIR